MSTILPSGIATAVCISRSDHPELSFTRVHVAPQSVDRHVSFMLRKLTLSQPPMRMMLPSGIATLVRATRFDHPALAFTRIQVAPQSVDRQTSFILP
jgi:hypothetical protein